MSTISLIVSKARIYMPNFIQEKEKVSLRNQTCITVTVALFNRDCKSAHRSAVDGMLKLIMLFVIFGVMAKITRICSYNIQ